MINIINKYEMIKYINIYNYEFCVTCVWEVYVSTNFVCIMNIFSI